MREDLALSLFVFQGMFFFFLKDLQFKPVSSAYASFEVQNVSAEHRQ